MIERMQMEEPKKREKWSRHSDFVFSCLGYAVGLGNIWRFPYLCYTYGGGTFIIAYTIMLFSVGIPAFFLELSVGQYSQCGPMTVWTAVPLLKGVGIGMILISCYICIFYTMFLGYSLHYIWASVQSVLPWTTCNNDYNTPRCYTIVDADSCPGVYSRGVCTGLPVNGSSAPYNSTLHNVAPLGNLSSLVGLVATTESAEQATSIKHSALSFTSSSEEYFLRHLLRYHINIGEPGSFNINMCLMLLMAWCIAAMMVIKGIRWYGKVVYITVIIPYVVLFILAIGSLFLPGAFDGIYYLFVPQDFSVLHNPKVWGSAAGQVFFSLSIGGGGLTTFASYVKFKNNIYRDSFVIALLNSLASILAAISIFAGMGFMSTRLDIELDAVVKDGAILAFVVLPQVLSLTWKPHIWCFLFFVMQFFLGIDSLLGTLETVMTAMNDCFPALRRRRVLVTLSICFVFFLLGLPLCSSSGFMWLQMVSFYGAGWSLVTMGLIEVTAFAWIYGDKRLVNDIKEMTGIKLGLHWNVCWKFFTPATLTLVLVYNITDFRNYNYISDFVPYWNKYFGIALTLSPMFCIQIVAAYQLYIRHSELQIIQRFRKLCNPSKSWGRNSEVIRGESGARCKQSNSNNSNEIQTTGMDSIDNCVYPFEEA